MDDLTVLEIINLLTIGISSFNLKQSVPNDIPTHNQVIPASHLESQKWLDIINDWTVNQKMQINEKKTKTMLFNFTQKYQFTTRLQLNSQPVEVIDHTILLGTVISDDLKWNLNSETIVKKANARMELLRKVAGFGAPLEDLKMVYILFIRSLLEQSATVWHSSLSQENAQDLERVQKSACRIILKEKYQGYKNALNRLDLLTLDERREELCLQFAIKSTKNRKTMEMFPRNLKKHQMTTRNEDTFKVQFTNTKRLKKSPIIHMQKLLNEFENR